MAVAVGVGSGVAVGVSRAGRVGRQRRSAVGVAVGATVGACVAVAVGATVAVAVGATVAAAVGATVAAAVGAALPSSSPEQAAAASSARVGEGQPPRGSGHRRSARTAEQHQQLTRARSSGSRSPRGQLDAGARRHARHGLLTRLHPLEAASDRRDLPARARQFVDTAVELLDGLGERAAEYGAHVAAGAIVREAQHSAHLAQRQAQPTQTHGEAQRLDMLLGVVTVPVGAARWRG